MGRILSGVQPTGNLHLGNYLGAIRNWVSLQKDHESLFCIVDLHALTLPQGPEELRRSTLEVAATYLACGIDPKASSIFVQSSVPGHSELAWLLGCQTPMGWLSRMTQFKEKAGKHKERAGLGLYSYPVLMAADILVYKATHVPVGDDQKQHLELTRDIAMAFNSRYGQEIFPLPEPQILGNTTRVMSLRDGASKMSKSEVSEFSRIHLLDDADTITLKIRKAKTDMDPLPETVEGLESRPEAKNLVSIYAALVDSTEQKVCTDFVGQPFSAFKPALADALISVLSPIATRTRELLEERQELETLLKAGAEKANSIAEKTLQDVHDVMGLLRL